MTAAAVVAGPHSRLGEVPVAFLTFVPGRRPADDDLIEFVRASGLARHKVPDRWIAVDELPLTASGKVRKRDLELLLAGADPTTSVQQHMTARPKGDG